MAEASSSEYKMFNNGIQRGHWTVDVADWSNAQDSSEESHQKRSDIVCAIITHLLTDHLRKILASGWDVNEILSIYMLDTGAITPVTALQVAAERCWTEGVKLLFDAGADYKTSGVLETLLKLALQRVICLPDLIDLLLKHGADPNPSEKVIASFPLLQAISHIKKGTVHNISIVKVLLENGADPSVTILCDPQKLYQYKCPVSESLDLVVPLIEGTINVSINEVNERLRLTAYLFKTLLNFGGDVNWNMDGDKLLLHRMVGCKVARRIAANCISISNRNNSTRLFLQEHLDIFYQKGGNINVEDEYEGTALEYALRKNGHSNSVRWLIRHGANVHPTLFTILNEQFVPAYEERSSLHQQVQETPLLLLRAGTRVSNEAYRDLINIKNELSIWKEQFLTEGGRDTMLIFIERMNDLWAKLVKEGNDLGKLEKKFEKRIFPEYWSKQMVDLEEFSDGSLNMYPESFPKRIHNKDELTFVSDQIHKVLEFLSQPQSLQWYCRRCVRENLVSLQPSVVKTLPVPARMKRYILCHEI